MCLVLLVYVRVKISRSPRTCIRFKNMCGLTRKSDKLIETDPLFSLVMYERKPCDNMTIILCDVRDGM